MIRIEILAVASKRPGWCQAFEADFLDRFRSWAQVAVHLIKPPQKMVGVPARLQEEDRRLLKALKPTAFKVALDSTGRTFSSSEALSEHWDALIQRGNREFQFVVGGAYGFGSEVLGICQDRWSLSPLTFNHQVAHMVLLEQLYRARCISEGHPYHHG